MPSMEPSDPHEAASLDDAEGDGAVQRRLLRRVAEARAALEQLEAELRTRSPKGAVRGSRRSAPPSGTAERELKRLQRELAQRRLELTELRTDAARALQRAEQENERLRVELTNLQRQLDAALAAQRSSGLRSAAMSSQSEPPAVSGVEGRQKAETLRPQARARGR